MSTLKTSIVCDEPAHGNRGPEQPGSERHWVDHLLDAVTVVSVARGRIRFHLGFEGDEMLADTVRRELQRVESVRLESYSVRTRNVLVTFDPAQTDEASVATALLRGVKSFARVHGECDLEHHHHERSHAHAAEDDCDHDHSAASTDAGIRKELFKLAATGAVLGYVIYKKIKGKPLAFAGNPLLDVASLVTIASGYSIFRAGVNSVQKNRKATDDTLISIAVVATLLMGESMTGLSVVWLINLGRLLEAITLKRSRTAIKDLMDISPKEAWTVKGQVVSRIAVEKVKKGERLRIFASEKAPLDGKILRGKALVREAFITGESIPREKSVGDTVYAGSLIEQGDLDLEVTNLFNETVVARMIDAIENVREQKAPIEKVGTRFAGQFIPISLGISAVTLILTGDLRRAITMLVIACPCAAGLATPTAVSASIGQAARRGILIKGGTHIEAAAKIDTIVFDKTGTLTQGEPKLQHFAETAEGARLGFSECLRLSASAEQHTTHPLGLTLVKEAKVLTLPLSPVEKYKAHPGLGIFAQVEGLQVHIGSRRYMTHENISVPASFDPQAAAGFVAGESILYLAIDQVLQGAFVVQDTLRPEAPEMLERLRRLGIRRVLLASGDLQAAAQIVGRQLGITEVHAELLPKDKLALIARLKTEGCRVAMVGDGVNDAQALAEADLSIAMGGGHCDIAMEAADVTLARDNLLLVADTLEISQKTLKTIYQNFIAAVGINAGGLVVSSMGKLSPFSAAIVHNASTIAVVVNSLRLGKEVAGSNPLNVLREVKI